MLRLILTPCILLYSLIAFAQRQTVLNMYATSVVHDPLRNKVYAVIYGSDPNYANSLVQIDCSSKAVERTLYVGSNPSLVKITSDHNFLYIALKGSPKVVRVSLETFKIDKQFQLGPIGNAINIYARDIQPISGRSDLIAVSREESGYVRDIALYKDGIKLTDSIRSWDLDAGVLACDSTGNVLYGYNNNSTGFDFGRIDITPTGLKIKDKFKEVIEGFGVSMVYHEGMIYTTNGSVVAAHEPTPYKEGTYESAQNSSGIGLNPEINTAYFGEIDFFTDKLFLRNYNMQNFAFRNMQEIQLQIPSTVTSPELYDFKSYGNHNFVMAVGESYFPEENENYIVFLEETNTSLSENSQGNAAPSLFPNPASRSILVNGLNSNVQLHITDLTGRKFSLQSRETEQGKEIDISALESGVYFVSDGVNKLRFSKL